MNKLFACLAVGMLTLGLSHTALAQTGDAALSQAKVRLACGTGTVIASIFLPNGSLQVTCSQVPPDLSSTPLQGTGLAAPTALAAVAIVTVLVIVTGGDDPEATTTTAEPVGEFR